MKFKILESNDYDYDSKDKNMITYSKWIKLRYIVGENPKRITFNPLEVELQKLHEHWTRTKRIYLAEKVIFPLFVLTLFALTICVIVLGVGIER